MPPAVAQDPAQEGCTPSAPTSGGVPQKQTAAKIASAKPTGTGTNTSARVRTHLTAQKASIFTFGQESWQDAAGKQAICSMLREYVYEGVISCCKQGRRWAWEPTVQAWKAVCALATQHRACADPQFCSMVTELVSMVFGPEVPEASPQKLQKPQKPGNPGKPQKPKHFHQLYFDRSQVRVQFACFACVS